MSKASSFFLLVSSISSLPLIAGNITPDFHAITTAPTQAPGVWYTDRYPPAVFAGLPSYQGVLDVLQIGVSAADQQSSRPAIYSAAFYNTQGRKYDTSGGAGSYVEMLLYIPAAWGDPSNGFVRSDMWATMVDSSYANSGFPIIDFMNQGTGGARYRVYDNGLGSWVNLAVPVVYDAWTTFRLTFTGTSFDYSINGVAVYSDPNIGATAGFSNVMVQDYNFGSAFDTSGSVNNPAAYDYSAYWASSNQFDGPTDIPEPSPAHLLLPALFLILIGRRNAQ